MHVVATAGHVDHGKSSLVRALTGTDPDRLAEEKRRGLTIDLGFAWAQVPGAGTVAFVDVPGHASFVPTTLAGVGPVPVALLVVAADGGWMPQSAEHLAALDALGVRHGLLVITRADLADPAGALAAAREHLAGTTLGEVPAVACSAVTGAGLPELRSALAGVLAAVPVPAADAPVRLWVDRAFTVRGAGTVVTGTLGAGTLRSGDELDLATAGGMRRVRVRGLQSLEQDVAEARGVARVAVNLRGVERGDVTRGDALLTPGWSVRTGVVDVRCPGGNAGADQEPEPLPARIVVHAGSAAVPARTRPLGTDGPDLLVRLQLAAPLPLVLGDRLLLRDPARHLVLGAGVVLDVRPPALRRRGAAAARAADLHGLHGDPDELSELRRRRVVRGADLRAMGVDVRTAPVAGDWHVAPGLLEQVAQRLAALVAEHAAADPLQPGLPVEEARRALALPDRALVQAALRPPLRVVEGRVVAGAAAGELPPRVARAVAAVLDDLAARPFAAPDAERLRELGLGRSELAAAVRAGRLERVAEGVVLAPGALRLAARELAGLPQPFTASQARGALGTSRRVALPLLQALDAARLTARDPDDRRRVLAGAR
ncbi:selenocysteine-specific translation elongation factor [Kineococcus auxinigenes]|uniref:selenocysteine-specific translation elongation factor n=1 Tax=unclassified Kineococcus TaxID=2621656 RepID=UPI003D7DA5A1